jgi:hypothetical protein
MRRAYLLCPQHLPLQVALLIFDVLDLGRRGTAKSE